MYPSQITTELTRLQSAAKRLRIKLSIQVNKYIALTKTRKGGMMAGVHNVWDQGSDLQRF